MEEESHDFRIAKVHCMIQSCVSIGILHIQLFPPPRATSMLKPGVEAQLAAAISGVSSHLSRLLVEPPASGSRASVVALFVSQQTQWMAWHPSESVRPMSAFNASSRNTNTIIALPCKLQASAECSPSRSRYPHHPTLNLHVESRCPPSCTSRTTSASPPS